MNTNQSYLLVDFNGYMFRWICTLETKDTIDIDYMRNMFLTAISNLNIYVKNDAHIIICTEGHSWRKTVNPYYKANRSKSKSKYDWSAIYKIMDTILTEFKNNLNWTIINHPEAEADDVIDILSKYIKNETIIISRDHDFIQLIDDTTSMYDPAKKTYVRKSKQEVLDKQFEHIVKGDSGDGVPNILSPIDTFVNENIRQTPMTKKKYNILKNMSRDEIISNPIYSQRYQENEQMVSFQYIPKNIILDVISDYDTYLHTPDVLNYIHTHTNVSRHINKIKYF